MAVRLLSLVKWYIAKPLAPHLTLSPGRGDKSPLPGERVSGGHAAKRHAFWLLCLFLLLSPFAASAQESCKPTPDYKPIAQREGASVLLYKIKRCGYPVNYVFGTFHSDSPELTGIYQQATARLQHTQQLVLEVVLSDDVQAEVRRTLTTRSSEPNLSQRLEPELSAALHEKLMPRLSLTPAEVERHKPWAIAVLAQYPPPEGDGVVLDEKLQNYAQTWGLKVHGLETVAAQLSIFDRMPLPMQIDFLQSTIDDADDLDNQHHELKELYLKQDINAIQAMSDRLFGKLAKTYPDLSHYLQDRVLIRRNSQMVARMMPLMRTSSFIAVGALHLPGTDGILTQLEKRGFEIWPVKAD